ncbi:MAG: iron-containing alcohol dehydrogenase, partial [Synergistaceae bacterium]|nr:iron-containing alcohol dehydrogenase [Synergistaceae bacterium]
MENFVWHNPTKVLFGKDTVPELIKLMCDEKIKNVLVLYGGKAIFKNGAYAQVIKALSENKINFTEIGGVKPNPKVDKVREAIGRIKMQNEAADGKFDAILPIGGGSVFDSA